MLLSEKHDRRILDSLGDGVVAIDMDGRVTYLNPAASLMTGVELGPAMDRPLSELFVVLDGASRETIDLTAIMQAVAAGGGGPLPPGTILLCHDGQETSIEDSIAPIRDEHGQTTGSVMVFRDVGEAWTTAQRMAHMAEHDFLTDLPNPMYFANRLNQTIAQARRHHRQFAVLFLDLDEFKRINDQLGHAVGDQVLQAVARRLQSCVRVSDIVSRRGGDEFVILLSELDHSESAAESAVRIKAELDRPYQLGDDEIRVRASIGISLFPSDSIDANGLLEAADLAMYDAKRKGRNQFSFFHPQLSSRAVN